MLHEDQFQYRPEDIPHEQYLAKNRSFIGSDYSKEPNLLAKPIPEKSSNYFSSPSIAASFGNGRLGNQICNLASLYAIYKEFRIPCYVSKYSYRMLSSAFSLNGYNDSESNEFINVSNVLNLNGLSWVHITNLDLMQRRYEVISPYRYSWNLKIEPYVCDLKGALPYINILRKTYLSFLPKVKKKATSILKRIRKKMSKNVMLVSIHVRLTDISYHLSKLFKITTPPREYFERAMLYITQKSHKKVVFLAFSDDTKSAKEILLRGKLKNKIIFPIFDYKESSANIILALLANVEGSILTYSTFGLWGALLRETISNVVLPKEIIETDIGIYVSDANITGVEFI